MREFRLRARVYMSDTDAGGIAYHRSYLDWAEHGRTEMFESIAPEFSQTRLAESGVLNVLKTVEIHYRTPAHLGDEIEIISQIVSANRFSIVIKQSVVRAGETLADLRVKAAFISRDTKRPARVPDAILKALEACL